MKPDLAEEWIDRARQGRCPNCDRDGLVAGPKGGASRNVFCPSCMVRWNLGGVDFGIITVDYEGACTEADIAHAQAMYPNDQPFKVPAR